MFQDISFDARVSFRCIIYLYRPPTPRDFPVKSPAEAAWIGESRQYFFSFKKTANRG
jgi:hypothetical protein